MAMFPLARAVRSGRKFQAPIPTNVGGAGLILKVLPQYLSSKEEREPKAPLGPFVTDPSSYEAPSPSGLRVTWFGHSSLLLEIDGVTVLVDPVWDERASPATFFGPKRFFAPTLPLTHLPRLDAVLLSHDHYDHLGRQTVQTLAGLRPALRWIVPLEVGKILLGFGVRAACITELDWTEDTIVTAPDGAALRVTSLPTRHFSGRAPWNRNETLWMSFALRGSRHNLYHGVDSGFWPGFETIGQHFGPFDLTLLEIGAFNELWRDIHLGPEGAVAAFRALGGGTLMPIHWGLFDLALHAWKQPIERVTQLANELQLDLFSPTPGLPADFVPGLNLRSPWWQREG